METPTLTILNQRRTNHEPSWCAETGLDADRHGGCRAGRHQPCFRLRHLYRRRHARRIPVPADGGDLMSLRHLPEAPTIARPQNYQWDAPSDVLAKWAEHPFAAAPDADATISIFDVIGEDSWTGGGVTANRISAALRAIGNRNVTVRINSPGGDMFEGIAIYNLLRAHRAKVTVEVLGWAASAASIIAMAGDVIRMGLGSFMMVHNAWGMVIGNRHDMREAASLFDGFDSAL